MSRPSTIPTWATGGGADVETPSGGKQALGYENGEVLSAGFLNWLFNKSGALLQWLHDHVPALDESNDWHPSRASGYGLVASFNGDDSYGRKARCYVSDYGDLVFTYGCYLDGASGKWKPDNNGGGPYHRLLIGEHTMEVQTVPDAAEWDDGDWYDSDFSLTELLHRAAAAQGCIAIGSGSPSVAQGIGIASVAYRDTNSTLRVTWSTPFLSADYTVNANSYVSGVVTRVNVLGINEAYVDLQIHDAGGALALNALSGNPRVFVSAFR